MDNSNKQTANLLKAAGISLVISIACLPPAALAKKTTVITNGDVTVVTKMSKKDRARQQLAMQLSGQVSTEIPPLQNFDEKAFDYMTEAPFNNATGP